MHAHDRPLTSASHSRSSCAKAGYFRDDFIHLFVRKSAKRSPLINRGETHLTEILLAHCRSQTSRARQATTRDTRP